MSKRKRDRSAGWTDAEYAEYQERIADHAERIVADALASGEPFSEMLCNHAIQQTQNDISNSKI